ncbi:MAG: IPTL-CTERM sorting domain-containing protein [Deltaproteobacteria bacterium]|nr:IPTL-CTERM sorting domain-containing protein [Deltaproteobacteria bacterium]
MNKTDKKKKKVSTKKREFNRRLLSYSLAAGTTLALATPANAAIRYSGVKSQVIDNDVFQLDMQDVMDGNPDFSFLDYHTNYVYSSTITTTTSGKRFLATYAFNIGGDLMRPAATGNAFAGDFSTTHNKVTFFEKGDRIGPEVTNFISDTIGYLDKYYKSHFHAVNTTNPSDTYDYSYKGETGNFGGKNGYIGVRFLISGKPHYGWIQFDATANRSPVTIRGWAYEDDSGRAIAAGDTGQTPIPTLNQWGMMFLAGLILLEGARRLREMKARENEEK